MHSLPWAVWLHLAFGYWMYGSLPSHQLFSSIQSSVTTVVNRGVSATVGSTLPGQFNISDRILKANSFVFFIAFVLLTAALILEFYFDALVRLMRWACFCCCKPAPEKVPEGAPPLRDMLERAAAGEPGGLVGIGSYRLDFNPLYRHLSDNQDRPLTAADLELLPAAPAVVSREDRPPRSRPAAPASQFMPSGGRLSSVHALDRGEDADIGKGSLPPDGRNPPPGPAAAHVPSSAANGLPPLPPGARQAARGGPPPPQQQQQPAGAPPAHAPSHPASDYREPDDGGLDEEVVPSARPQAPSAPRLQDAAASGSGAASAASSQSGSGSRAGNSRGGGGDHRGGGAAAAAAGPGGSAAGAAGPGPGAGARRPEPPRPEAPLRPGEGLDDRTPAYRWSCAKCTYDNGPGVRVCSMCREPREAANAEVLTLDA